MESFIKTPSEGRAEIFTQAANQMEVMPELIEKDFWVCWTLMQLFTIPEIAFHLTFKGGTSLSKAYQLIQRFSEDIDLTFNKDFIGIDDSNSPAANDISQNERNRRLEKLKQKAEEKIAADILPLLEGHFAQFLPSKIQEPWHLEIDAKESQTILFHYPKTLTYVRDNFLVSQEGKSYVTETGDNYITTTETYVGPVIRLEFGARGDITPHSTHQINSYVAEQFPQLFTAKTINIMTLEAERTFWEKATILHALYHSKKLRPKLSRHYYDLFMMAEHAVAGKALADVGLLEAVVKNKSIYFKDAAASYETAKIGTLKLVPDDASLKELEKDYAAMQEMLFGNPPSFAHIIAGLSALEARINRV